MSWAQSIYLPERALLRSCAVGCYPVVAALRRLGGCRLDTARQW